MLCPCDAGGRAWHYELRRGYWSALAFTDAQIGRVLSALETSGHKNSTIVAVVGDHGYGLGELGSWGKYTLLEQGTRAPMIISKPGQQAPGHTSAALVEFVDLMSTLADLAGLPPPPGVDGISLAKLLDNPTAGVGKGRAFSQYPSVHRVADNDALVMGTAIRVDRYRYVAWCRYNFTLWRPDFDACVGHELYAYEGGMKRM